MKYLQCNDVHSCDRPPRYRTDSFTDDIFNKLRGVNSLAKEHGCDFILYTGDLFHQPAARRVSHYLVNCWMLILDEAPCPVYLLPGNHDLAAGRMESVPKQPLGTLGLHPNATLMSDGEIYYPSTDLTLCGVGWNYGINGPYIREMVGMEITVDVLALHAPIMAKPNPHFHTIQPSELTGLGRVVSYGHIHAPAPVYKEGETVFSNPGALGRCTLGQDEDTTREPSVAIITLENPKSQPWVQYVPVPHRPAEEIYRVDLHAAREEASGAIEDFVRNLGSATVSAVTVESLAEEAKRMAGDDPKVVAKLEEILYSVA